MRGRVTLLFSLAILLILVNCDPKPTLETRVKDMVVKTIADISSNFSTYSTYSLAIDTVGVFWSFDPDTVITDDYAQLVSRTVKTNMDNAGYTRVGPKQKPDLAVNVFLIRGYGVDQTFITPNYYLSHPGNYTYTYSGYGGYSPYPYIAPVYTSSTQMLIELIDLKNIDAQQRVKIIWTTFAGDVDASPDPYGKSKEAVNQAFMQSPYIKK